MRAVSSVCVSGRKPRRGKGRVAASRPCYVRVFRAGERAAPPGSVLESVCDESGLATLRSCGPGGSRRDAGSFPVGSLRPPRAAGGVCLRGGG